MTSQFKELLSLGFTPAAALSITACIALWARMWIKEREDQKKQVKLDEIAERQKVLDDQKQEAKERENDRLREAWHTETRKQVAVLGKHVDDCNEDRVMLKQEIFDQKLKISVLEASIKRMETCPNPTCPLR